MTHAAGFRLRPGFAAGLVAVFIAGSALAQANVEPWRARVQDAPAGRAHVTSSAAATAPTAKEQREARVLATAVFAKPAAAQRAADKVAPPAPDLAQVQPKAEWTQHDGPQVGGDGLKVSTPF